MPDAQNAQTVSLVVSTGLLLVLARRLGVPSTVVLLFSGMALGVAPGLPRVKLDPPILPYLFLPPISTAGTTSRSTSRR